MTFLSFLLFSLISQHVIAVNFRHVDTHIHTFTHSMLSPVTLFSLSHTHPHKHTHSMHADTRTDTPVMKQSDAIFLPLPLQPCLSFWCKCLDNETRTLLTPPAPTVPSPPSLGKSYCHGNQAAPLFFKLFFQLTVQ